ncbi:M14 family zinc carboxypeptidase [candidate division KSB1 bacterium]
MKTIMSVILTAVLLISAISANAQTEIEGRYRIEIGSTDILRKLQQFEFRIIGEKTGEYIDVECTVGQMREISRAGFTIESVPPESDLFYSIKAVPDAFHDYAETVSFLTLMAAQYSSIAEMHSIGKSTEGRDIWALKISDNPDIDEDEPCFLTEGCMHGNEHHGSENVLNFIRYMLEGYGSDPEVTYWIDNREIWCVPLVNPDGHELNQRRSYTNVDLNRNFGYFWGFNASAYGDQPFGEPETAAIRSLIEQIRPYASIAWHTAGRLFLYPWAYIDNITPPDIELFLELGTDIVDSVNAVDPAIDYELRRAGAWYWHGGTYNDWIYSQYGMMTYTGEMMTSQSADSSQHENEIVLPAFQVMLRRPEIQGVTGAITDSTSGAPLSADFRILEIFDEVQLKPRYSDPATGRYLRFLTPGTYTLQVTHNGYESYRKTVTVTANEPVHTLDIKMRRMPEISHFAHSVSGSEFCSNSGNGKGVFPQGGVASVRMKMINTGFFDVHNVYAILSTQNSYVTITQDSVFVDAVDSGAVMELLTDFELQIDSNIYPGAEIAFQLDFFDGSGTQWSNEFVGHITGFFTELEYDKSQDFYTWHHASMPGASNSHDDWQWGLAGGKTTDPDSGYSGEWLWGTDLGGSGYNGDYQNNVDNYLEMPSVYVADWPSGYLQFYRWLNVLSGDTAYIKVNDSVIWTSFGLPVSESSWTLQTYDISSFLQSSDSVHVVFGLRTNNSGVTGGWNIDDIRISQNILVSVDDSKPIISPDEFQLYPVYPNPFNSSAVITFDLPGAGTVDIGVYNILGQRIKTIANRDFSPGTVHLQWNGDNDSGAAVSTGIYFLRCTGSSFVETQKMMLVK